MVLNELEEFWGDRLRNVAWALQEMADTDGLPTKERTRLLAVSSTLASVSAQFDDIAGQVGRLVHARLSPAIEKATRSVRGAFPVNGLSLVSVEESEQPACPPLATSGFR